MDRLGTFERLRARDEPWDIVAVGGGATGVGCALDAAVRGLDVLLLEQHDLGKGTSSRSTKLVHGGVRYLRQGNLSLVREALKERGVLLRNAPHVVHKQAFIVPCYSRWQKYYYGAGLKIYDLLAGKYGFGRSRTLSREQTIAELPTVLQKGLAGGVKYWDGQFDDMRLLIDLARSAEANGAAILNYARVTSIDKDAEGRAAGVTFEDVLTGERIGVRARAVINATGAFCDSVRAMSSNNAKPIVALSQGIHLVLDRSFLPFGTAMMIPKTSDRRVLICIPWLGKTLIGTTDTPIDRAELEPAAMEAEIDFVLETAGAYLEKKPTQDDILSVFAGIRPLARLGSTKNTAALSRGHLIDIDAAGMVTITGGKWTTYRRMAEDAVDQAMKLAGFRSTQSVTLHLAIAGPDAANSGAERLHAELPYTAGDVIRAVKDEMAQTVEDVLARRTRALLLNARAAIETAPDVAAIMAAEMGKDDEWAAAEVKAFRKIAGNYLGRPFAAQD